MRSYFALIRKEAESDFGVDFPDFPGCVTAGTTLDEAGRMAEEALALHIEGMAEDGVPLPEPMLLDTIMADPGNREAVPFLVSAPSPPGKPIHVDVILPEDLVRAIDRTTKDRSRFLTEAARAKLRDA